MGHEQVMLGFEMHSDMQTPMGMIGHHKELWPPATSDYVGLVFTAIGLMICAGGGIGGGGLLVPIFIFLMDFSPKAAIVSS